MRTRHYLPGVIILLLLPVTLFAGGTAEEGGAEAATGREINPAGTFPIVNEQISLSVFTSSATFDFETNEFTKWLEEKTNIHVEWELVPGESLEQKRNLLLVSGDYPDVLMDANVSEASQMIYGSQGVFLPLNDYIEEYGVNTRQIFERYSNAEGLLTAPDDNIYSLPEINECFHCKYYRGRFWIYQPWLDTLGLEVPETLDDLYRVLKAFKTMDPNGNGQDDEIPLSAAMGVRYYNNANALDIFVMNTLTYDDAKDRLILNDGKIDVIYDKPEWREGLRYLNKLFREGLINTSALVQNTNQLKQLGENKVPVLGAVPAGHPGQFTQYQGESGRFDEFTAVPPFIGKNGKRTALYDPYLYLKGGRFVITNAAENPEATFRWADVQYSRESTMRSIWGRPGIEWKDADSGQLGINGKPALFQELEVTLGQEQNVNWSQRGLTFRPMELRLGRAADQNPREIENLLYNVSDTSYAPYAVDESRLVPPLWYDESTATELADLKTTITDYWLESFARFVMGDLDLDSGWDGYIEELNAMGLERYIQIMQTAYDEKYE